MKSSFNFISYKIDRLDFKMKQFLALLEQRDSINPEKWHMSFALKEPLYFSKKKYYVGGLESSMFLYADEEEIKKPENALVSIEVSIVGAFSTEDERFTKDIEDKLVKIQIPAILMPYMRAAITSTLSNAGFGSAILPLINIQGLAATAFKDKEIKVID